MVDKHQRLQEIYQIFLPRIYGYVASRLADVSEAEDVVSEVFLKVVKNFDQLRSHKTETVTTWIFTIAHHTLLNRYRQKKLSTVSYDDLDHEPADMFTPDTAMSQKELMTVIRSLLELLPPRQQEVIALKFFSGLRNQEIAAVLGLDERTVAAHLSRGLRQLYARYLDMKEKHDG